MAVETSLLQNATAFLNGPTTLANGLVRGTGKLVLQHELADKTIYQVRILGEGEWDSIVRLWVNRKLVALPNLNIMHFHPGTDAVVGAGMNPTSTGGDQLVDLFFADLPAALQRTTFSRYAYIFLKIAPDPGAPSAEPEVLFDAKALKERTFTNLGAQNGYLWTDNWIWCSLGHLLRKFVLRDAKINQPLVTAQRNRFDWGLIKTAADYADVDLGGGIKRFSEGGLAWDRELQFDAAIEQMLLMFRGYLLEADGKLSINVRKSDASVYTFTLDDIEPGSFKEIEGLDTNPKNQIIAEYIDLNRATGSNDDATRMNIATPATINHEAHQLATGFAALGLARIPSVKPLTLDYGVNTGERVHRLAESHLLETLGERPDPGVAYKPPFWCEWIGLEHTVKVMPGDTVTIHQGISEEYGGNDVVVLQVVELMASRKRRYIARQKVANAYPDTAPAQQGTDPPNPGTGSLPVTSATLLPNPGGLNLNFEQTADAIDSEAAGWFSELGAGAAVGYETGAPIQGARSAKLTGTAGNVCGIRNRQFFMCDAGDRLHLRARAKCSAAGVQGCVRFAFYDGAGAEISTGEVAWTETAATTKAGVFTAPANTVKARIEGFYKASSSVNGDFIFDAIYCRRMIPAELPIEGRTPGIATLATHLTDAGALDNADNIAADGTGSPLSGGRRGFNALNSLNALVTGTTNRTVSQLETGVDRATNAIDSGNVVVAGSVDFSRGYTNKHLGNVPDDTGSDRRAATANEKTGGTRGFNALDSLNKLTTGTANKTATEIETGVGRATTNIRSDGLYVLDNYHGSAARGKTAVSHSGNTTQVTYTTISSWSREFPASVTVFKASLTSLTGTAAGKTTRLKIGGVVSSDVTGTGTLNLVVNSPPTGSVTVELQAKGDDGGTVFATAQDHDGTPVDKGNIS